MVASLSFNPQLTTTAGGTFNIETTGYIQGTAIQDPAVRFALAGGRLSAAETLAMWGGVAIAEAVPGNVANGGYANALGGVITRATTAVGIRGWSVFDQDHAMLTTPQSPVPTAQSGMLVNFYRLGSGARIAVACDPTLADLELGDTLPAQVSWDFTNQQLIPYASATVSSGTYASAATISSGTYNSTTGAVSLTTNAAHGLLPGDTFTLSGMTGTGSFALLNGTWTATTGTTGSTLDFTGPTFATLTITGGNLGTVGVTLTTSAPHGLVPGDAFVPVLTGTGSFANLNVPQVAAAGTTGSTLTFTAASGLTLTITGGTIGTGGNLTGNTILPVRVLDVQVGNSMTVVPNPSLSGSYIWNRSGSTAIILI